MAQLCGCGDHGHVIDIGDVGGGAGSCCAVCMEHLDWVAVGPCAHREVCSKCAVHLRFLQGNRQCCICRAECPTVVVTKAGGEEPAPTEGSVGRHWCHAGAAAYFDGEQKSGL